MVLTILLSLVVAVVAKLLADEAKAWLPWIVQRLIRRAVQQLSADRQERWEEEWNSDVNKIPGDIGKFIYALGYIFAAQAKKRETSRDRGWRRHMWDVAWQKFAVAVIAVIIVGQATKSRMDQGLAADPSRSGARLETTPIQRQDHRGVDPTGHGRDQQQNDPHIVERDAREHLHYVRPGQVIHKAPPKPRDWAVGLANGMKFEDTVTESTNTPSTAISNNADAGSEKDGISGRANPESRVKEPAPGTRGGQISAVTELSVGHRASCGVEALTGFPGGPYVSATSEDVCADE